MNHLTTLYVNQADRERQIAEDLRNRQIQHAEPTDEEAARLAATAHQPQMTNKRQATLRARTAGR